MGNARTCRHARETAPLFTLGILEGDDARDFQDHLGTGCAECQTEVDVLSRAVSQIGLAPQPVSPPAGLRERVLARADLSSILFRQPIFERDGFQFVRLSSVTTQNVYSTGVHAYTLSVDAKRGYQTRLIRLDRGAAIPAHRHAGIEESFVLSGSLVVESVKMGPGDYCRAERDTVHRDVHSPDGCVFVAVSSDADEFLST